jgi:hypothetical protein
MGIKIRYTRALIGFLPIGFWVSGTHCHPYVREHIRLARADMHMQYVLDHVHDYRRIRT